MATITPGTTPIPYTYGGHTYWLMPDGRWANAKNGSGKVPQSAIDAILAGKGVQENGYGGTGTEKPPAGGTGASGPVWNPTPIPHDYTGGASFNGQTVYDPVTGARSYSIGYGDLRTPLGTGVTTTPSPSSTGSGGGTGTGSGSTGGSGSVDSSGGQGSGSGGSRSAVEQALGSSNGGNAGGAMGADRGSVERALGGRDGSSSGGSVVGPGGYINLGKIGSGLLSAAALATPFPYSLPLTLAQAGMRGWNTAETDSNRAALGIPGLDTGQALGSILGWNNYGSLAGNQTIANREQGVANPFGGGTSPVTTGGLYHDAYGPMDMFGSGEDTLAYTPAELSARRSAAAGYDMGRAAPGSYSGTTAGASATPGGGVATPYGETTGRPSPVAAALAAPAAASVYRLDGTYLGTTADPTAQAALAAGRATVAGGQAGAGGLSPSIIGGVGGNGGYMSSRAGQGSFSDGMGGTTSVGASGQLGHI